MPITSIKGTAPKLPTTARPAMSAKPTSLPAAAKPLSSGTTLNTLRSIFESRNEALYPNASKVMKLVDPFGIGRSYAQFTPGYHVGMFALEQTLKAAENGTKILTGTAAALPALPFPFGMPGMPLNSPLGYGFRPIPFAPFY